MTEWCEQFTKNFHMDSDVFEELFKRLRFKLEPKKRTRPDGIGAKQRLAYTLEYVFMNTLRLSK